MHAALQHNSTFLRYYNQYQQHPDSILFVPIAQYYLMHQLTAKAKQTCLNGLEYHPDCISGLTLLIKCYIALADWHAALNTTEKVLTLMPDHSQAMEFNTRIRNELGLVVNTPPQPHAKPIQTIDPKTSKDTIQTTSNDNPIDHTLPDTSELPNTLISDSSSTTHLDEHPAMPLDISDELSPIHDSPIGNLSQTHIQTAVQHIEHTIISSIAEDVKNDTPTHIAENIPDTAKESSKSNDPTNLLSWETVTMADIYAAQGHHARAKSIYESILKQNPDNIDAKYGLEQLSLGNC